MYTGVHVKYLTLSSDFQRIWIFSTDFGKNLQISNFIKIRPVGAELFRADGRTDGQMYIGGEANSRFRKFCESDL
jgi:hypothetical protein